MTLSEFEIKRYQLAMKKFLVKRRPHPNVRSKCDLACRLENHTVEVFEIRPQWDDPEIAREYPIAKAVYQHSQRYWEIYWLRSSLKWQRYQNNEVAKTIEDVFAIIDCDEYGVFFG